MNHRELNLHNIIKQQQAKISQLKQQLSMVAKITQSSFLDSQKRNIQLVVEKDDIIIHLKRELDSLREKYKDYDRVTQMNQEFRGQRDQLEIEYSKARQQAIMLEKRVHELQYKLQLKVEEYEKRITILQRQNKRITTELQGINQNFNLTQGEIDKLTKFYKSSNFDIPKRKQTLLWVDNLIKYMQVNESNSETKYQQLFEFVNGTLSEMQKQVMKAVSQVAVIEEGLVKDGQHIIGEMRKVCEEMKGKELEIGYGIDELIKTGKKEKQSGEKAQLQGLKSQLQVMQQESRQTITVLKARNKQLQTEKKTLVLGFQQIKTFLQNKQSSYKQQIHSLKNTINQLLQANQLRETQFQQQIKLLSQQIQAISMRYYQNIQYPVLRMNEKVQKQLNSVKGELVKLSQQNRFKEELVVLTERLKDYGDTITGEEKQFQAIQLCMKKGNELLITIRQLLAEMAEKKSERRSVSRMKNSQHSVILPNHKVTGMLSSQNKTIKQQPLHGPSSIPRNTIGQMSFNESNVISYHLQYQPQQLQQLRELQSVVSQIQLKQRQNKLNYEVNLLKKHNQKLTDHLTLMEKKFKHLTGNKLYDEKAMAAYFMTQRKLIDLQAELQQAKQANVQYERLLKEEIEKSMKKFDQFRKQIRTSTKEQSAILQALNQLNDRHSLIAEMMANRYSRISQLQHSATNITNMLIKPSQTFEALVKQFTSQMSSLTLIHNQHTSRIGNQHWSSGNYEQSGRSRLSINESTIKEYQQILTKRSQINSNGSKYIVDLIRTIRETFPVRDNKRRDELSLMEKENLLKGQPVIKSNTKNSTFQKRIKEIIATQQKYKQQLSAKIDKLSQTLTNLQTKRQKQTKLSTTKQRKIQQLLQKYIPSSIKQIKLLIERETKQHIGLNTQALRDTASKLRESIRENQGLKREMDVMLVLGKNGLQKQENFYQQG